MVLLRPLWSIHCCDAHIIVFIYNQIKMAIPN